MAVYEEIADTRPRIRGDVLFTSAPAGVLFHNAHGGFTLATKDAYRFASLIVPHLNGDRSVAELCLGLTERQQSMVVELIAALYKRGFARDAGPPAVGVSALPAQVATRFAAQLEYIDHYVGDAEERFQRFRQTRVAVLGDDPLALWCVLSLIRNGCCAIGVLPSLDWRGDSLAEVAAEERALADSGCPVSVRWLTGAAQSGSGLTWADLEGFDLVVATRDQQVLQLLEAGIPPGQHVLPAWRLGERQVIGPVMTADSTGCWVCAALRLGANTDPGALADLWSGMTAFAPAHPGGQPLSSPLAAMLGNLLGFEVFRLTTGALPAETAGRLVIQDLNSLDTVCEPLLPHPCCLRCARLDEEPVGPVSDLLPQGSDPASSIAPAHQPPLGGSGIEEEEAAQAALLALETRSVLLQPHTGVFAGFADDGWTQTPLKIATVKLGVAHGIRREISAFDVHHVAGARLRALYRAAEVYAEHVVPLSDVRVAASLTWSQGEMRIGPAQLSTWSGTEASPAQVRTWCAATCLRTGGTALIPAGAARPFGPYNHQRTFEATSTGMAAGASMQEATVRGLQSALAFDALRQNLRGQGDAALFALDIFGDDPELTFLARSAENLGLGLELLELGDTLQQPLPVVLARTTDPETGLGHWALAGALHRRQAALEAVRDLLGQVQLGREQGRRVDTGDPVLGALEASTLAAARAATVGTGRPLGPRTVLERLHAQGRDVLVVPVAAADLQAGRIHAVRVLLANGDPDVQ
ncbi:bacteriocin biosynthesis cyclodehydratase domain-containing protein [Kitasatospora sp. GAS204A]|uniref:TOMM precursor leader peptide-binding protein n=1 Tax=unclassified Kitasatospora TaxID=2633591 RepID=UPI00247553A1|nr:TOMM precursor leader peptide-binding protein [Kitasatospora sp. GAS204B]MDH6119750.1 bacteriocin biosynthesis cyclodehydratase domain-containing protein [Kitasatospora sp. GAS204B]